MSRYVYPGTHTLCSGYVRGDEIKPNDCFGYKVVAIISNDNLHWAAYRGPTNWADETVGTKGDAIGIEEATALFPVIAATHHWNPVP